MRLTESQNRVVALMSGVAPMSLYPQVAYGSIPTLTTTDNQVYTFGTDPDGYAKFPLGKGGIYQSLNDIPDWPLVPNVDYMVQGQSIRALNNQTLPATLYWYGMSQPSDITGISQPALMPEASRELIVIDAVRQFAQEWARNPDLESRMEREWDRAWPVWCLAWKTQFAQGGAIQSWSGMQLALAGQWNTPPI